MKRKIIENVQVVDIADKGKAIGRQNDLVFLIEGAVPGDVVDIEVKRKRKSMWEGRTINTKEWSTERVDPFCSHFGACGGCKWQHLDYQAQLHFKSKRVNDAMIRLAGLNDITVKNILPAPDTKYYRNKLEYSFSNKRWLTAEEIKDESIIADNAVGFHVPGRFDKVIDITKCYLQDDLSNKIRNFVRDYAKDKALSYYDLRGQFGFLRNMIVRNSIAGDWMLIMIFGEDDKQVISEIMNSLQAAFPEISSLQYVINTKANDTIYDLPVVLHSGDDHITEQLENIKYRIGPKTFFQTNTRQSLALYRITRDWAGLTGTENVYDLYTGTGSIALFLAHMCRAIVGVDSVPEAIEHAELNAVVNGIGNAKFLSGDMRNIFDDSFVAQHGKPDVIITDPPRAGMHEKVVEQICRSGAKKIIYISCNPATQARDIKLLLDHYTVDKIQPLDMFPHTDHVENIVSLILK